MKILIIHNHYQNSGGEDTVVANEKELLELNGHDVQLYSDDNSRINSAIDKLGVATSLSYSKQSYRKLSKLVKEFAPNIIHAHNLFPLITTSAYDVAVENAIAIIQTLHNYRSVCASGLLLRNNKPCELCLEKSPYSAVLHKCYRGSALGSLAVAHMINTQIKNNILATKVDYFIALTEFSKSKLVKANIPAAQIIVKPNYTSKRISLIEDKELQTVLFVGRLSPEKGIETLINVWLTDTAEELPLLKVIGDGPLYATLKKDCSNRQNIEFMGHQPKIEVEKEMFIAKCLVFPSVWYEGFPMVLVEALASGLPIICSRIGSMSSIIEDQVTGLHFRPGDSKDLFDKLTCFFNDRHLQKTLRENCIKTYLKKYTPEKNYEELMSIYLKAIENYQVKIA